MSPRNKAQNEQIRQERRQAILQAAIPRFALNGYSATSMSDIARDAGVSHGTVFLYFPTKDDLFRAALAEPLQETEQHFREIAALPGTPLERLERIVRDHVVYVRHMEQFVRLTQYVIGQRERFPEMAQLCFDFGNRFSELMASIVEEGQQAGQLAETDLFTSIWAYFTLVTSLPTVILGAPDSFWENVADAALRIFAPLA